MKPAIGQILPEDEMLIHQTPETFATISQNDLGWTEKIWCSMARRDGSLQADFGLGRYQNRNVMDAFAGVIQGRTQRTVRASRELASMPTKPSVGPIHYEIIEPLQVTRFALDANDTQPISYDLEFVGDMPCVFEDRQYMRDPLALRDTSSVIRYHQSGSVKGWIEIDGKRHEVKPEEWFGYRDHSWGVRPNVGATPHDTQPHPAFHDHFLLQWSPMTLTRPDGSKYSFQYYLMKRGGKIAFFSGYLNHQDGRQERIARVRPELRYDDRTRQPIGGTLHFDMLEGGTRSVEIETVENGAGFHLGTGLYTPLNGFHHGSWRGELHVEGECHDDVLTDETLRLVHQLRDGILRVKEGDATGHGIFESMAFGEWPEFGLTEKNSYN